MARIVFDLAVALVDFAPTMVAGPARTVFHDLADSPALVESQPESCI